jgi:hypothetical protein
MSQQQQQQAQLNADDYETPKSVYCLPAKTRVDWSQVKNSGLKSDSRGKARHHGEWTGPDGRVHKVGAYARRKQQQQATGQQ